MKKYKSLIVSSLVLSVVLLSPSASFAQGNNDNGNKEQRNEEKGNRKFEHGNWGGRFGNWYKYYRNVKPEITTAPVISNLTATSARPHRATIIWNTDVKSNSQVWFSKTSPVDTTGAANITRNSKIINHKIVLTKLDENTKYYVIVKSTDKIGTTTSSEVSFTTTKETVVAPAPVVDTTNPVISNIQTLSGSTTGTISWTTDETAKSSVYYSTVTPLDVNAVTTLSVVNASLATNHSLNITGLTSGTVYHFIIKSADASNNTAVSSEGSFITN
jgi:hypothetical protein